MAQEPRDLVLEYLRRLDGKFDSLREEMRSWNLRMTAAEQHILGQLTTGYEQSDELDRLKRRVDRIERRLELTDPMD